MAAHADRIGPSSLARARRCPGSVRATKDLPRTTTEAAAEGSMLHEIAADCIEHGFEPWDFHGQTITIDGHTFKVGEGVGEVDTECMVDALDWIREQPGRKFVEQRVSLDPYLPGQFGTLDLGIIHGQVATVFDWKFGWVLVDREGNEQLLGYAFGFLKLLRELGYKDPKTFRLMIEQPRPPGGARYYEPWEVTLDEVLAFADVLRAIWAAAEDPDAPRVAGDKQCYWCAAKDAPGGCHAYTEFQLETVSAKFEDLDDEDSAFEPPPAGVMTPERRAWVIFRAPMLRRWLDELSGAALADAVAGLPTPNMKAIEGAEGNRVYRDEDAVKAILVPVLGEKSFNMKLISPAQVDKLFKPTRKNPGDPETLAKVEALTTRPPGKPVLVSDRDPRPAISPVDDKFDEETEDC